MRVITIKPIGFCSGVKNILDDSYKYKDKYKKVYIIGSLIHNEIVIKKLKKDGFSFISNKYDEFIKEIKKINKHNSLLIISAHGVEPRIASFLVKNKFNFIDKTCPLVKKNNENIKKSIRKPLIIGSNMHDEGFGISKLRDDIIFINQNINKKTKYNLFSVTSITENKRNSTIDYLKDSDIKFLDKTFICPSILKRQKEFSKRINSKSLFLIVGSKKSNNTKSLLNIYYKTTNNKNCFIVNRISDLSKIEFPKYKQVYLLSGTSANMETIISIRDYIKFL